MSPIAGGKIDILVQPDAKGFGKAVEGELKSQTSLLGTIGKGVGVAMAAGTGLAAAGLTKVIALGNAYTANLNELQAVTGATGDQMAAVSKTAIALGNDMTLPGTSAADAAQAMLELSKGGLSVADSMTAAKGTLQLAAAASVDAGTAAELQSKALNEFGLSASSAGHVADVLANTANAAAGEITDIGYALNYVGPVAKSFGISIDDTAAAIGLLANKGIQGEQAGTSLRGMLASLASPSKQASAALSELGVKAFDSQGKFVGLEKLIGQLAAAQGKLTQAQFEQAAATAFGNEGLTVANALASSGTKAFTDMAASVSKQGGAADVAAAKMKGLGGALEGFQSQAETLGIDVYQRISPALEGLVRAATTQLGNLDEVVSAALDRAVQVATLFGPKIIVALQAKAANVAQVVTDLLAPLAGGAGKALNAGLNAFFEFEQGMSDVAGKIVAAARPIATGVGAVLSSLDKSGSIFDTVQAGLHTVVSTAEGAATVLGPLAGLVGGLAQAFSSLPGPVQTAVVAFTAIRLLNGPLTDLKTTALDAFGKLKSAADDALGTVTTRYIAGAFAGKQFLETQAALAPASGAIAGTLRGAIPALGDFGVAVAGAGAVVGGTLKSAMSGLVSFLGGPWGIALAAAGLALGVLAGRQQDAARAAQADQAAVEDFTSALKASNGAIDDNVRSLVAKKLQDAGVLDAARKIGVSLSDVTTAAIQGGPALDAFKKHLEDIDVAASQGQGTAFGITDSYHDFSAAVQTVLGGLDDTSKNLGGAVSEYNNLKAAVDGTTSASLTATATGSKLSDALGTLGDKASTADQRTRALQDALDALSGQSLDLETAQGKLQDTIATLTDSFGKNFDASKGAASGLIDMSGKIDQTTQNGRDLYNTTLDLRQGMADVARAAFDASQATKDDLATSTKKAADAAQVARDRFIDTTTALLGSRDAAVKLADQYGLIPEEVATVVSQPGMSDSQKQLVILKAKFDEVPGSKSITVSTLSADAQAALSSLGFQVTHLPDGTIRVDAPTGNAQAAINNLISANNGRSITINAQLSYPVSALKALHEAAGGIVEHYATGGLRPMRGGYATVVAPNTWRVIGDRVTDDEAYIPINSSARSIGILAETARRMDFVLMRRFAAGGVATGGADRAPVPAGAGATINVTNVVPDTQTAYEAGRVAAAQIAWELRRAVR